MAEKDKSRRQREDGVTEIRISADGRVMFHDMNGPLARLALTLAPENPELLARVRAAEAARSMGLTNE
ncbi:MAG: hypothetical protein ACOYN0_14330 [Phycisphaerales bacterium]